MSTEELDELDELLVPPAKMGLPPPPWIIADAQAGAAATFVAVTVTLVEDVTDGAVNRPLLVIEPALAFHVTAVFGVEVRVATNCCIAPEEIVALEGESVIPMEESGVDVAGVEDGAMLPHPVEIRARAERKRAIPECLKRRMDGELF
jgi:hypothetical protein